MILERRRAERKKAKLRLGLSGPAGSGKTLSSLLIAYGLCKDWSKITCRILKMVVRFIRNHTIEQMVKELI